MHFLKARNKGLVVTNSNFELTPNLHTVIYLSAKTKCPRNAKKL